MSKLGNFFGFGRTATIPQSAAGFRLTSSAYGLVLPLVYGTTRVGANVIQLEDPKTTATQSTQRTGKGSSVKTTNYTYTASVALGLAEGPIAGVLRAWIDKTAHTWAEMQGLGYSLFTGSDGQVPWGYVTTHHANRAVPYQHTAYVAHPALDLPNNTIPTHTFEVQGLFAGAGGLSSAGDAHPADVLLDFCTHPEHGAGIPANRIGDLSAFRAYCTAAGILVSPAYTSQRPAKDHLAELLLATNTALVWSDGVAKLIPYADTPVTGHGVTYTPNSTPLFDLSDVDFLRDPAAPITVERVAPADAVNALAVEYESRTQNYAADVVEWQDQAAIDAVGRQQGTPLKLALIKDATTALQVAQTQVQRTCYVRNTYVCAVGWRYSMLEPMDLVTLTDPGLGLDHTPVRIVAVGEASDVDGIELTCEDWPLGTATATRYATAAGAGAVPVTGALPGATHALVVTAPQPLASSPLELWLVASGGAAWGGCEVWWSVDGQTYQRAGAITRRGTFGPLVLSYGSAVDITLVVDTTGGGQYLPGSQPTPVSAAARDAGVTLWAVDTGPNTEFLAWSDTYLWGAPATYAFNTIRPGLYGTPHHVNAPVGTPALALDDAVFVLPVPGLAQGQVVSLKLPAFNGYGGALQSLADCTPITTVLTQGPAPSGLVPIVVTPRVVGIGSTALTVAVDAPDPLGLRTPMVRVDGATGVPGGTSGITGNGTDGSPYVIPRPASGASDALVTFRASAAGRLDGTATLAIPAQLAGGGGGGGSGSAPITGVQTAVNRAASSVTVSWPAPAGAPAGATYTVLARVAGDGTSGTPHSAGSATSYVDDESGSYTFSTGGKSVETVTFEYQVTMQSGGSTVAMSDWYATAPIPLSYSGGTTLV